MVYPPRSESFVVPPVGGFPAKAGVFSNTENCGHLANKKPSQKAPAPREFERTRFAFSSNVPRIHEERGFGGEEQEVWQLLHSTGVSRVTIKNARADQSAILQ